MKEYACKCQCHGVEYKSDGMSEFDFCCSVEHLNELVQTTEKTSELPNDGKIGTGRPIC